MIEFISIMVFLRFVHGMMVGFYRARGVVSLPRDEACESEIAASPWEAL